MRIIIKIKFIFRLKIEKERIIMGIDPGTQVMGYGILRVVDNKPAMEAMGVMQLNKYGNHYLKLAKIYSRIIGLIDEYLPDELAIEAPFYGKNVQSMLKLGRAQGVAIAAAISRDIPIFEYAPLKIKMAITGNGNAAKHQVAYMLQKILQIADENMLSQLDATDGLAAALCHFYQSNISVANNKYSDWKDFVKNNPDRVKG